MRFENKTSWRTDVLRQIMAAALADYGVKSKGIEITVVPARAHASARVSRARTAIIRLPQPRSGQDNAALTDIGSEFAKVAEFCAGMFVGNNSRVMRVMRRAVHDPGFYQEMKESLAALKATPTAPEPSLDNRYLAAAQKRLERSRKMLATWERKAKLAQNRAKKYSRAVTRHENQVNKFISICTVAPIQK